jgi:hypothetical protein
MLKPAPDSTTPTARVQELLDIAVRGLRRMFDETSELFCDRLMLDGDQWQRVGISERYSLMCYLGLHEAERSGIRTGFDPAQLTRNLAKDLKWLTNIGDLGCLLWAVARITPEDLSELWPRLHLASALERYVDARTGAAMELAFFLTGIAEAHCKQAGLPGIEDLLNKAEQRLMSNRGESGLFGHMARKAGVSAVFRGHIGSFADQVYPTIAMAAVSKSFGRKDALDIARTTARKVSRLQGPLGQWWWHYNSDTGTVVSTYPVYSVHQHAMAPMMLFAVMDAGDDDFTDHIFRGLKWIDSNELGIDMCEFSAPLIWRSIAQTRLAKWNTRIKATLHPGSASQSSQENLSLVAECRPYELGWLLYAFSSRVEKIDSI